MAHRISDLVMVACLIVLMGCATGKSEPNTTERTPNKSSVPPKAPDKVPGEPTMPPGLVACRERVKSLNADLVVAITIATREAAGTPVRATEIKKSGHRSYRVLLQGATGKPKPVDVEQRNVDDEKIVQPSSLVECKSLVQAHLNKKEENIVAAIRRAEEHVKGRAEDAGFERQGKDYVYVVTVADSKGQHHIILVDADEKKIVNDELITK